MCMLAQRYEEGVGVKQSDKKAIELYKMAAKRGQAAAQFFFFTFCLYLFILINLFDRHLLLLFNWIIYLNQHGFCVSNF